MEDLQSTEICWLHGLGGLNTKKSHWMSPPARTSSIVIRIGESTHIRVELSDVLDLKGREVGMKEVSR